MGEAEVYFHRLQLEGRRGQIADKILKELRARYRFLVDVGLSYLSSKTAARKHCRAVRPNVYVWPLRLGLA